MAPHHPVDRDNGMRRISTTTRWLAGAGVALVAAFSGFFAAKASNSSSTPTVNTPSVTTPATVGSPSSGTTGSSSSGSSAQPTPTTPTSPPVTYAPQIHSRSGGS